MVKLNIIEPIVLSFVHKMSYNILHTLILMTIGLIKNDFFFISLNLGKFGYALFSR